MLATRTLAITAVMLAVSVLPLHSQDKSGYREFLLGGTLPSISALAKVQATDARTIHDRPAILQELEWRPQYFVSGTSARQSDPVQKIVFSFYNDQLSKMVVDYDHDRTAGMTGDDMIEAISIAYGPAQKPLLKTARTLPTEIDGESSTVIARWGDADYSVILYRAADLYGTSATSRFRLIVASPRLDALAHTADLQAVRLDLRDAPKRELARQKKDADDARLAREKARLANKAAFRP